jgi:protection-of-telomeres protein 1
VRSLLNREAGLALSRQPETTISTTPVDATPHRSNPPIQGHSQKFSLIQDVTMSTFVDLVVHVVKTYYEGERLFLYVTDYTPNQALFNYSGNSDENGRDGDEFGYTSRYRRRWEGPSGKLTLQVTLWDPHSYFARQNVRVDDYVLLRNVNIKTGHNGVARLEGSMHTDRMFRDKINVVVLNGDSDNIHLRDLTKRKREYWKSSQAENSRLSSGPESIKRKLGEGEKVSGKAKKKQKNKGDKEADQAKEILPTHDNNTQLLNSNGMDSLEIGLTQLCFMTYLFCF